MHGWLNVCVGDVTGALRQALAALLQAGVVDALLTPLQGPAVGAVTPALVRDPARLSEAAPLAPTFPLNSATLAGHLTKTLPQGRIGVWLRPCEVRALVELAKLKQAQVERLFVISMDCLGACPLDADSAALARPGLPAPLPSAALREACALCEQPVPGRPAEAGAAQAYQPDLAFGWLGVAEGPGLWVQAQDPRVGEALGLQPGPAPEGREAAIQGLLAERTAAREAAMAATRARLAGPDGLLEFFAPCIRCHNCMVNCPICYCPECIFRTPTFQHLSTQYVDWVQRKGAIRMPTDTLLFHLTRLNHMVTSCVGCGMCSEACPAGIPVATVFRTVGQGVQALFHYLPGRSLEEEVPLATFREDELGALAEGYLG
ncbi:MAG: formate dehydrogenase [Chloroflexi bacterium]|nr:formate dehydrogenase [Chloroflexota bacterium]